MPPTGPSVPEGVDIPPQLKLVLEREAGLVWDRYGKFPTQEEFNVWIELARRIADGQKLVNRTLYTPNAGSDPPEQELEHAILELTNSVEHRVLGALLVRSGSNMVDRRSPDRRHRGKTKGG